MNLKHTLSGGMFRGLFGGMLALATLCAQAATPTHIYLMNNASDVLGGPALTSLGGTFGTSAYGQTGYTFAANQGLSVSSALNTSVYTIDLSFAFNDITGYRRIVDFLNLTSDSGLYVLNSSLNFFTATSGPSVFTAQQLARVTVTRDAAGLFTGYVNGVQQISFADTSNLAQFSGPSQIAYFFRDDNAIPNEASAGFVDYISIYNVALSPTEVFVLQSPVPEPAGWALMLAGAAALLPALRRRRAA